MRMKYGENSDTLMIVASGNTEDFGQITSASQEINNLLGYNPDQVIGLDVSKIVPRHLAEIHTGIMTAYFETGVNRFVNTERLIFPERKDGFITPSSGLLRILPYLEKGVQMIVFMKASNLEIFADQGVIITDTKGIIVGVNKIAY